MKLFKKKEIKFKIVVPDQKTKKQFQAEFENFVENDIIIDSIQYRLLEQTVCQHKNTRINDGIKRCLDCEKEITVISYRD